MTMAYQLADMLRPAMWMIPVMEHKKWDPPFSHEKPYSSPSWSVDVRQIQINPCGSRWFIPLSSFGIMTRVQCVIGLREQIFWLRSGG